MASFNQRAIKWIDYIKENCIDALKKYCEDQSSNDLNTIFILKHYTPVRKIFMDIFFC